MFQAKSIPLTGKDRSKGERLAISSGGGIYFDSAPAGLSISFDDSPILLPVKAGRSYDVKFSALTLWHAPGYAGELLAILYEKGEGIFDSASTSGSSSSTGAGSSRVMLSVPYQSGAVQHMIAYAYNPVGSGVIYTLRNVVSWQSAVSNSDDEAFEIGAAAAPPGAIVDGQWGVAPKDSKAVSYMDSGRMAVDPPLMARWSQGGRSAYTRRIILYPAAGENKWAAMDGFIIRPGHYFAYSTGLVNNNGYVYMMFDEQQAAS